MQHIDEADGLAEILHILLKITTARDDRQTLVTGAQPFEHFKAGGTARHGEIQDRDAEALPFLNAFTHKFEGTLTTVRRDGVKTVGFQHGLADGKNVRFIINDQYACDSACGEFTWEELGGL